MRPIYLYVHIPKTGGTSIRAHLRDTIGPRLALLGAKLERDVLTRTDLHTVDVVLGHGVTKQTADMFPTRETRFITALREPAAYALSAYNWAVHTHQLGLRKAPSDFRGWLSFNRNPQSTWLVSNFFGTDLETVRAYDDLKLLREASNILRSFWLVLKTERIAEGVGPLLSALGAPPLFNRRANMGGRDYEKVLRRSHELDGYARLTCAVDLALFMTIKKPVVKKPDQAAE